MQYLADVPAKYYTTLVDSDRRNEYFYIDTGNTLEPGKLYEVLVIPRTGRSASIDVFTGKFLHNMAYFKYFKIHVFKNDSTNKMIFSILDCDIYTFPCTISGRPVCLESNNLCDGVNDCANGADELKREDNQTW